MAKTLQQLEAEKRAAQERKDALYAQYKIDQQIARENAKAQDLTPAQQRQLVKEQTANSYATYKAAESEAADADWEVEKYNIAQDDLADFGPDATYQESGGGTSTVFRQTSTGNTQQLSSNDPVNQPYTPDPPAPTPQTSTADQPIPFIGDETYLDPLYEPAPTSPTVAKLPTSPYDINQDGVVSDSEYLYGDDPYYEPVPTDAELASLQEQMDEDAEFAAIDEEFTNLPSSQLTAEQIIAEQDAEFTNDDIVEVQPVPRPPRSVHDARKPIVDSDWRFRISLSPYSDYLYNSPDPGILRPLKATDGVVFPYTPSIVRSSETNYQQYDLIHSNFRGYFYSNSREGDIMITADFTAQDTAEAQYMLAMMHFFRAAGRMWYGQDARRGTPPPLVYLRGLGEYQYNEHACLLSRFTYTLPDNVDYIKTSNSPTSQYAPKGKLSTGVGHESWSSKITRMITSGLENFFDSSSELPPIPNFNRGSLTKITDGATYVPTKLQIQLNLLPVQTRHQVSTEYNLKDFASGKLLKKGYW